jgi:hypothetical protein
LFCNNSVLFDSLEFFKIENQLKSAFIRVCLLFVFPKQLTPKFVQIFGENCCQESLAIFLEIKNVSILSHRSDALLSFGEEMTEIGWNLRKREPILVKAAGW